MRVGSRVKHIFSFSFTNRRPNRSAWKGKSPVIDDSPYSSYSDDDDDAIHISEDEGPNSSQSDDDNDDDEYGATSSSRYKRVRIISWRLDNHKMRPGRCRWTLEQERRLQVAQQELARCQKAWSSEQEVWLKHIEKLHEEKEAHEDFLHLRAKQQQDERVHFRKALKRRQQEQEQGDPGSGTGTEDEGLRRNQSRLRRLRRFS